MARFLFTVWSFPGNINPSIGVALALRARGHDVAFYTGTRAAKALGGLELTHFPMVHVDEEAEYESLRADQGTGLAYSLADLRRLRATLSDWLVNTMPGQLDDLLPILDRWRPDVIVCDPMMWTPFLLIHEMRSLPVTILSWTAACMISGRGVPWWGLGQPPPTTLARRLGNTAGHVVGHYVSHGFRTRAEKIRRRYGLPPLTMPVMDFAGTMPLYLVTAVPEIDYNRRALPPSVHYVGRCNWALAPGPMPEWIAALPPERPLIYATEGTVETGQPRLLQAVARGLAGLPLDVLLKDAQILWPGRDPAEVGLGSLAPNIHREGYVLGQGWQSELLARVNVFITNGGAGSVLAALDAGVPLIIVPTTWDKPENAQRVVAAGAGITLAARHCSPERLREAVQRVLAEPSFKRNALRVSASMKKHGGPERAADLLEDFARRMLYDHDVSAAGGIGASPA